MVGGQHPEVDHPTTEFTVSPTDIKVGSREILEVELVADGRAEFPVRYELVTADIPWISLSEFGTLTLSPGSVAELLSQEITATDALGVVVTFAIQVAVS